jgi:hypothetical protein
METEPITQNIDYENLNRLYLLHILDQNNINLLEEYIELNPNKLKKVLIAFQESNPTIYETSDKEVVYKIETKMTELANQIEEVEKTLYHENADMTYDEIKQKLKDTHNIEIPEDIANHIANEYINYYKNKNYNKNKKFWQSTKMYKKKYMDTIKNKMVELRDSVINKFKSKQDLLKVQNLSDEEKQRLLALEIYNAQKHGGKRKKRKTIKKKKNVKKRKNTKRKRI